MSTTSPAGGTRRSDGRPPEPTGWLGWIVFAGTMMVILGSFHAIAGLVAIFKDDYYLVADSGLVVSVDYAAWGWLHLILGLVIAGAGVGLLRGQMWARVVAVIVASISAIVNLVFMSAYPLWSAIMIALDILVIYAVTAHGREAKSF
jgi:hypothetical protein